MQQQLSLAYPMSVPHVKQNLYAQYSQILVPGISSLLCQYSQTFDHFASIVREHPISLGAAAQTDSVEGQANIVTVRVTKPCNCSGSCIVVFFVASNLVERRRKPKIAMREGITPDIKWYLTSRKDPL